MISSAEPVIIAGDLENGLYFKDQNYWFTKKGNIAHCFSNFDFCRNRFVIIPAATGFQPSTTVKDLQFLTEYSVRHAYHAFLRHDREELAVSLMTEYGRQLACGASLLISHIEIGKRYIAQGALYLFSEASEATPFSTGAVSIF